MRHLLVRDFTFDALESRLYHAAQQSGVYPNAATSTLSAIVAPATIVRAAAAEAAASFKLEDTTVSLASSRIDTGAVVRQDYANFAGGPKTTALEAFAEKRLGASLEANPAGGFSTTATVRYSRPGVAATDVPVRFTVVPLRSVGAFAPGTSSEASAALVLVSHPGISGVSYTRLMIRPKVGQWHVEEYATPPNGNVTLMTARYGDCLVRSALTILQQKDQNPTAYKSLKNRIDASSSRSLEDELKTMFDVSASPAGQKDFVVRAGALATTNLEEEYKDAYITGTLSQNFKPATEDRPAAAVAKKLALEVLLALAKHYGGKLGDALVNTIKDIFNRSAEPGDTATSFLSLPSGPADQYIAGDWDGSGDDELAARYGNVVYFQKEFGDRTAYLQVAFGNGNGDQYLAGDWNGTGVDKLAVRRGNKIYFQSSLTDTSNGSLDVIDFGNGDGDRYAAGDFNGDGLDELSVRRGNVVAYQRNVRDNSNASLGVTVFGAGSDFYLLGDWTGTGKDTLAFLYGGTFHYQSRIQDTVEAGTIAFGDGNANYLVGDWDGDNKDTVAIQMPGRGEFWWQAKLTDIYHSGVTVFGDGYTASVPAMPTGLTVRSVSTNTVNLAWSAGPNPLNFIIEQWSAGTGWIRAQLPAGIARSTSVGGLTAGTSYQFAVRAVGSGGQLSEHSNIISVSTQAATVAPQAYYNVSLASWASGLVLDADTTQGLVNGNRMQLWSNLSTANQRWDLIPEAGGVYKIVNRACGRLLDANFFAINQNGCTVHLWEDNGGAQQRWLLDTQSDGSIVIRNALSGKALDANAPQQGTNGAAMQLWDYIGGSNQKWRLA